MKLIICLILASACDREPSTWVGIDRQSASCTWLERSTSAVCISDGRRYHCVREIESSVWRCAPSAAVAP